MSKYNFTIDASRTPYTVKVDPVARYGYFEHDTRGEDSGGGLWFAGFNKNATRRDPAPLELADYDGISSYLPRPVVLGLRAAGCIVGEDFNPNAMPWPEQIATGQRVSVHDGAWRRGTVDDQVDGHWGINLDIGGRVLLTEAELRNQEIAQYIAEE